MNLENLKEPIIPFTRKELIFNYSNMDKKIKAKQNRNKLITLYKGALRHRENIGFKSLAILNNKTQRIVEAKKIVEGNNRKAIHELFDRHTSNCHDTPFLSATLSPGLAQHFAPTSFTYSEKTIYQLQIRANRCVYDWFDTGNARASNEYLILGAIFPEEIKAFKVINDNNASELNDGRYIYNSPSKRVRKTKIKDLWNWEKLR